MNSKISIFNDTTLFYVLVLVLNILTSTRGCKLIDESGAETDLTTQNVPLGNRQISDSESPGEVIYSYTTVDIQDITEVGTSKYLSSEFKDNTFSISIKNEYATWEEVEAQDFNRLSINFNVKCINEISRQIEFGVRINISTNNYQPQFLNDKGSYNITLPMPLGNAYVIAGDCGEVIEVVDYDYSRDLYQSSVEFETRGDTMGITATLNKQLPESKKFFASLVTTQTLNIERPLTFTLVATDIAPSDKFGPPRSSSVTITITPDIAASTPPVPVFSEPIYTTTINPGENIISPLTVLLNEGYSKDETEFKLSHGAGENLETYFSVTKSDDYIEIKSDPLPDDILGANHGLLVLEATRAGAPQSGYTVIHISLPGSMTTTTQATTTECPTTESTTENETCPPCPACPTTESTVDGHTCPTCPTSEATTKTHTCPTCPTECPTTVSTSEGHTCPTCPEECSPCTTENLTSEATTGTQTCPTECPTCPTQCPIFPTYPEATSETHTCPTCPTECPTTVSTSEGHTCPTCPEECSPCTTENLTSEATTGTQTCPTECPICPTYPEATSETHTCPTCPTECPTTVSTSEGHTCPTCPEECSPCTTENLTSEATTGTQTCPTECPICPTYPEATSETHTCPTCPTECPICPEECSPSTTSSSTSESTTGTQTGPTECPTIVSTSEDHNCPPCPSSSTENPTSKTTTETQTSPTQCPPSPTECQTSSTDPTNPEGCSTCVTEGPTSESTNENQTSPLCPTQCPPCTTAESTTDGQTCLTECPQCTTSDPIWSGTCPPCPTTTTTTPITVSPLSVKFREKNINKQIYKSTEGFEVAELIADVYGDDKQVNILYSITKGGDNFELDSQTGSLKIKTGFTEEQSVEVKATISVSDAYDTAEVNVKIIDAEKCEDDGKLVVRWKNSLTIVDIEEEEERTQSIVSSIDECTNNITHWFPETAIDYFEIDGKDLKLKNTIDRENSTLFGNLPSTEIVLHVVSTCPDQDEEELSPDLDPTILDPTKTSTVDAIGNITRGNNLTIRVVIKVLDKNEYPIEYNFESPAIIGYPDEEVSKTLLPQNLMKVEAKDRDLRDNAEITCKLESTDEFEIDESTGIIYPIPGKFKYEDTSFVVHTNDPNDSGLRVYVKILNEDNLLNMIVEEQSLKDVDTVLKEVSSSTGYNLKSLSATLIVTNDIKKANNRILSLVRKERATDSSSTSYLQLIAYGLDGNSEIVKSSAIVSGYGKNTTSNRISLRVWDGNSSGNSDGGENGDSEAAVIALSVVTAILAIALGGFVVLYVRLRRNGKTNSSASENTYTDEKENFGTSPEDEEHGFSTPIEGMNYNLSEAMSGSSHLYETVEEDSQKKIDPVVPESEPIPEHSAWTVLRSFEQDSAEEIKSELSKEGDDNDDDDDDDDINARKKSIVTFNENVERIEIEPV